MSAAQALETLEPTARSSVSTDSWRVYLNQLSRNPLLSAQDEVETAKEIEAGLFAAEKLAEGTAEPADVQDLVTLVTVGEQAHQRLVQGNLRLVVSIAKKYQHRGLHMLDLVQEGSLGLMRAVQTFDYRRGFKFSTYATWWIRQALSRAVADQGRTIRVPSHVSEALVRLLRTRTEIAGRLGREPSPSELADELGLGVDQVCDLLKWANDAVSLDRTVGDGASSVLGDMVPDAAAETRLSEVADGFLRDDLARVMAHLDPREQRVLRLRFGLDGGEARSLEQIATLLAVSPQRVRQVQTRALARLRMHTAAEGLVAYLR